MDADTHILKRDFAQTLARGMAALEVLSNSPRACSVSEVAAAMNVSRAAARRVLLTHRELGYVTESDGHFMIAPKVLSIGRSLAHQGGVWATVAPEVVRLANFFNEPCSISVLEGADILYVCRDSTRRMFTTRLGIGDRLPANCSAAGKMLLASLSPEQLDDYLTRYKLVGRTPASITDAAVLRTALDQIRKDGWAMAIDEMEEGTIAIAAPIRNNRDTVVAAFSISSHRSRQSAQNMISVLFPELKKAAKRVEEIVIDFQDRGWIV